MAATTAAAAVKKSLFGCPEIQQHSAFKKGKAVTIDKVGGNTSENHIPVTFQMPKQLVYKQEAK